MTEANKQVFNRLSMILPEVEGLVLGPEVVRYIETDPEEKEFLKHSKVEKTVCLPGKPVIGVFCQAKV